MGLDFLLISERNGKGDIREIYPRFTLVSTNDIMIKGGDFCAIWDESKRRWLTSEIDAIKLIDKELCEYVEKNKHLYSNGYKVCWMWDTDNKSIDKWHKFCKKDCPDNFKPLDSKLIFANDEVTREDYATRCLPYSLAEGDISAYESLLDVLYAPEERLKIEWIIGSIISGDSKTNQKFGVIYGKPGAGKSTILSHIIEPMFCGYWRPFSSQVLGNKSASFPMADFKDNPLLAIEHDGDLSRIEDNTRINSIVSHETIVMNEKYLSGYPMKINSFLLMCTNKPVRISDSKSGILRRLIDIRPTGNRVDIKTYWKLVNEITFEFGAIAYHCLKVYEANKHQYDDYIPTLMMGATNDFYNYVMDRMSILEAEEGISLTVAYNAYKNYCEEANVQYPMSRRIFQEELKSYFDEFYEIGKDSSGKRIRSLYKGFRLIGSNPTIYSASEEKKPKFSLSEPSGRTQLDLYLGDSPAQYANKSGIPRAKWENVKTTMKDIDSRQLHYVVAPGDHIFIDFDLRGDDGEKSLEKNLEAAEMWPETYAEVSKGGNGLHLHYIYLGDPLLLDPVYDKGIEIKISKGNSAIRRKVTKCHDIPIATIRDGLPQKGGDELSATSETITNERHLRRRIAQCLRKETSPYTAPCVKYIYNDLEQMYESGVPYDVSDLKSTIYDFASQSHNQRDVCLNLFRSMHFSSDTEFVEVLPVESDDEDNPTFTIFDIEVYPNLLIVCWKVLNQGTEVMSVINPSPDELTDIWNKWHNWAGYNCRRYDNHIICGRKIGDSLEDCFTRSQAIIKYKDPNAWIGAAWNESALDIYDMCTKKQSLKKWEIELEFNHEEMDARWDQPLPEELWPKAVHYCKNDVLATEAVFNHNQADWKARQILVALAKARGCTNATWNCPTNKLTQMIIFGTEKNPQKDFIYTDLSQMRGDDGELLFPGYEWKNIGTEDKPIILSTYKGIKVGEGGFVYSKTGMYDDVATCDVASEHPHSMKRLWIFGPWTKYLVDLVDTRIYIKHGEYGKAKELFDGALAPYLDDPDQAKALSGALKLAINSVYGLTFAGFDNLFRDPRNMDNIVAKYGSLFAINLKEAVENEGYEVLHIKTDSIKIHHPDRYIIEFIRDFGKKYGFTFEIEAEFEKICLTNKASYVGKQREGPWKTNAWMLGTDIDPDSDYHNGKWETKTKTYAHPYVRKVIFTHEPIDFYDLVETKSADKGDAALYLEFDGDGDERAFKFVGKVGGFVPVKPGTGGGLLRRITDYGTPEQKVDYANGAKGYFWKESSVVKSLGLEDEIDKSYYEKLADTAIEALKKFENLDTGLTVDWFLDR